MLLLGMLACACIRENPGTFATIALEQANGQLARHVLYGLLRVYKDEKAYRLISSDLRVAAFDYNLVAG